MWKIPEKRPFFRADMAGLGIYHMGGYGRIGVYRVILRTFIRTFMDFGTTFCTSVRLTEWARNVRFYSYFLHSNGFSLHYNDHVFFFTEIQTQLFVFIQR